MDDPVKNGYPGPPGWGLGMRLTTSPHKKVDNEKTSEMPWRGLINRRRSGSKEKDLTFGTWNIQMLQNLSTNICAVTTETV